MLPTGIFADTTPFLFTDAHGNKLRFNGHGDAGNVAVQAADATITDGGEIAARTFDTGDGGSVVVNADDLSTQTAELFRRHPLYRGWLVQFN